MTNSIGPITPLDEQFCHQVVDTFAVVGNSDPSWTEKVCAMAAARDGSLQLGFGLGKYPNRNVIDAYAGISRGVEQITVRASRELASAPTDSVIGPPGKLGIDPGPFLGGALRHWSATGRYPTRAPARKLPLLLDTELSGTSRRKCVRHLHGI